MSRLRGELRAADGRLYDNEVIHFGKQRRTRRAACAYLPEASRIRSVNSSRESSPSRLPRFESFSLNLTAVSVIFSWVSSEPLSLKVYLPFPVIML